MNLRNDHAHWYVQDLEESISFFKLIGFKFLEYSEHGGKACMMQSSDGWMLEVQEVGMIQNPGLNHLAFTVDDLDALCVDLESKGYKVDGPMDIKLTGRRLAMVRDPNGIFWQLVQSQ